MPDVHAAAGDLVEITAHSVDAPSQTMIAKIMTKDPAGKYEVQLAGEPFMRGLIRIEDYEWSHDTRRWRKREAADVKAPTPAPRLKLMDHRAPKTGADDAG
jgi:hypothetical protein